MRLLINENHSTMISVRDGRLSVHRIFLSAPDEVLEALARFVKGTEKRNPLLQRYIQEQMRMCDYSSRVSKQNLIVQGRIFDLQALYDEVNGRYFNHSLNLSITWFGQRRRRRSRMTFGLYYENLKLIKIHRLLDAPWVKREFVAFTIYHEMLHAVIPSRVTAKGRHCHHGPEFKRKEREFEQYAQVIAWEQAQQSRFYR